MDAAVFHQPLQDVTAMQNVQTPNRRRPLPLPESNRSAMQADMQRVSQEFVSSTLEYYPIDDGTIKHIANQMAEHFGGPLGMAQLMTEGGKGTVMTWFVGGLRVPAWAASVLVEGIESTLNKHQNSTTVERVTIDCMLMGEYRNSDTNAVMVRPYRADMVIRMNRSVLKRIHGVTGASAFNTAVGKWEKYGFFVVYKEKTGKKIVSKKRKKHQPTGVATDDSGGEMPFKVSGGKRYRYRVQRKSIRARMKEMEASGDTDLLSEFKLTLGSWLMNGFNLDGYEALAEKPAE